MFKGNKMKAVTFSYDDGVTQDKRLIKLFDKYGVRGTFNINSELLGLPGELVREGVRVSHVKINPEEVRSVYEGHEIASHTLTHPFLPDADEAEIIRQVETDRVKLSELAGYEVRGFAYPGGGVNFNARVADVIRRGTLVRYARTTADSGSFALPADPYTLHPTVRHMNSDEMWRLAREFVDMTPDEPALFYIWGHSYEFDIFDDWARFEEFLRFISGREDVFYGTNSECLGLCGEN